VVARFLVGDQGARSTDVGVGDIGGTRRRARAASGARPCGAGAFDQFTRRSLIEGPLSWGCEWRSGAGGEVVETASRAIGRLKPVACVGRLCRRGEPSGNARTGTLPRREKASEIARVRALGAPCGCWLVISRLAGFRPAGAA